MILHTAFPLFVWLTSFGVLYYIYRGYLGTLRFLTWMKGHAEPPLPDVPPCSVTVLLTVHNEEDRIASKLDNLISLDYDRDRMQILVASDGSTDRTNEIVRQYTSSTPLQLLAFDRLGKSEAQNRAIQHAHGEIIAFTDAGCTLSKGYLRELVWPFANERVGCVTGHLQMLEGGSAVSQSQGYYWVYELKLRELESKLGILAVASGAAMAVRRSVFLELPSDVGEDCIIPLDVVLQGFKVVHASAALATDSMESDPEREFRDRIRMTMRNWKGTWRRGVLLNPLRYPGYAFALWSHKLLRWLSPILILLVSVSSLAFIGNPFLWPLPLLTFVFFALAVLGWIDQSVGIGLPMVGTMYSFCLANLGFLIGVTKALAGRSVIRYK